MDPKRSKVVVEQTLAQGQELADGKWKEYCEGLEGFNRISTAIMLENTDKFIQNLDETTRVVQIGTFTKYVFPLIRAIFPNLVATEICSVQPMTGPVSLVFYFDFVYGTKKGQVSKGDKVFDSVAGPQMPDEFYSSETVVDEAIGAGDGATAIFSDALDFIPVKPGSVTITTVIAATGAVSITDDGAGNLVGAASAITSGTIDYNTGVLTITFAHNVVNAEDILVTYDYDSQGHENIPEVDILLTSSPVTSRSRKLRARWGLEAANNLRALYGLDADTELTAGIAELIRFEIDREVINKLWAAAYSLNTVTAWSKTPAPLTISYTEHKLSIIDKFVEASNNIFKATKRATGNWIVMGVDVDTIVQTLPGFKKDPGAGTIGVVRTGVLNGTWTCYKDPWMVDTRYLMGHKGVSFLESGFVYAPYIPLMTTPTVVLDDFLGRKGILTQYATKLINGRFYAQGSISA